MGILILIQESLSRACTRHVTPPLVTKAVEGIETTHDLQQVSSSKSWLSMHYFKIPTSGIFRVLHNKGSANSSTDSANSSRSSLFALLLKLRTFSTWKILFLTSFVCESCTNFSGQAVMLLTLAKQVFTLPRACKSTCHRTDPLTFISIYRL